MRNSKPARPGRGQGGGEMRQIDPGPGLDDVIGKGDMRQGFGEMQGDTGQTLVSDEQVGPPAQVKDRPALSLGRRQEGRRLVRSPWGQQPLGRSADAPGGAGGQGVLAGGLGEEFGQVWGERFWFLVFSFQFSVSGY